jgi:undecaprenyl-diphosphatase
MHILQAIILGIIEGLTEFLPISSTAHLIVAGAWLQIPSSDFLKTFEISIQLGAILAVVILYWKKIWSSWNLIGKLAAAFIPTSIIGLILYKTLKSYLMDNLYLVAATLLIGGIVIIIFEKYQAKKYSSTATSQTADLSDISYRQAVTIGVCQSLAIVPGVSRSAATIIGGLSLGVKKTAIVEFSFLLAIPTMLAATGLDLFKSRDSLSLLGGANLLAWLVGFLVSFITALLGVKFFLKYIQKNNFSAFGWYRVILGIILLAWLLL